MDFNKILEIKGDMKMCSEKIKYMLYYIERMNLKEKEIFFWEYFKILKYDKLIKSIKGYYVT